MLEFATVFNEQRYCVSVTTITPLIDMMNRIVPRVSLSFFLLLLTLSSATQAQQNRKTDLLISRPARTWEFLPAVGHKAALLGHESGVMEAWVYPLKVCRDFQLVFHFDNREVPAQALVRTLEVRPEGATLIYSGDTFSVRETFLTPPDEQGAIIALEVSAFQPLDIEVRFQADLQLMWPGAIGGTYASWNESQKAFVLGEEQKKWFAMVGSPTATDAMGSFDTNYFSSGWSSFRLGQMAKGNHKRVIVVAASTASQKEATETYQKLSANFDQVRESAAKYYEQYLEQTTSLSLPDADLQRAYDWSRVSVLQGLVTNPFLGTGLVAGYRTSGLSARPGFAWFFGRDSEWTSLALNSVGDFQSTRTALDFISKFQRADGRVPHEISQSAKQVPWFDGFPYAFASADATPLFIIAVRDYYEHSGDTEFVTTHWDNVWRAYQFLRSTWDQKGIPRNFGVGHGWIEGGPLLPVKSEFYQSGLGAEALNALATLARVAGKNDVVTEATTLFGERKAQLNTLFWNPQGKYFAFAVDQKDQRVDIPTVLTTVPMWFGVTDVDKTNATITQLADSDHAADWGMRIISDRDSHYDPSGYHFGSVWPLFTGWASVAEYRYHRPIPAYENLRANSLLALNGSAGHTTEVLSGSYFEGLSTSSPHQIWSAAMVVSPMLKGLLGIEASTSDKRLTVAPHLPGDWTWWKAKNVRFGSASLDFAYESSADGAILAVTPRNAGGNTLQFSPSFSPRARVLGVDVNGRPAKFAVQKNSSDQHVVVSIPLAANSTIKVKVQNDFALAINQGLPELGQGSRNLKVVSETWSNDAVTYEIAGVSGMTYEIGIRGDVASMEGAELAADQKQMKVTIPAGEPGYKHVRVTVHFGNRR